jgi:hypothetical protein
VAFGSRLALQSRESGLQTGKPGASSFECTRLWRARLLSEPGYLPAPGHVPFLILILVLFIVLFLVLFLVLFDFERVRGDKEQDKDEEAW